MKVLSEQDCKIETFNISRDSKLYKHIIEGNYREGDLSFENPVPTLLVDSCTQEKMCVFSYSTRECLAPTVYFYDLKSNREVAKASGASIFLHTTNPNWSQGGPTRLYFYCDQRLSWCQYGDLWTMDMKSKEKKFDFYLNNLQGRFQSLPQPWNTWYETTVDFSAIRSSLSKEC